MERKPRSDSKLDSLPESRVCELRDGLLAGWKYDEALEWLRTVCKVQSTGFALSRFYQRHCAPLMLDRRRLAAMRATTLAKECGRTDWGKASMELVEQMTFEMLSNPQFDPKTVEKFLKLMLKAAAQETDARKLAIIETKAKAAEKAKEVLGSKLTAEEQTRRLKEILK